jgi:nucleoside-diphosphate-sugar epimerase
MSDMSLTTVLVTGGSGFIGSYVILALLSAGYTVRSTIRSLSRESSARDALKNGGASDTDLSRLSFVAATLDDDAGWTQALQGCKYVHHIASPFPLELPKHEDDLIIPAREGTLRVLRAAAAAGVERVILTSSGAAVEYGHSPSRKTPLTEEDWTTLDNKYGKVPPYMKSKTIAERAAWEFIKSDENGAKMELTVIIPVMVSGPVLGKDISTSVEVIKKLMDGSMPGCPNLHWTFVDVRDVASVHLAAMLKPEAAGERFIAAGNDSPMSLLEIGKILRAKRPQNAKKVPSIQMPNFLVHFVAFFDKPLRQILPELGKINRFTNQKSRETFGWQPRAIEESMLDTADSLVKYGMV